MVHAATEQVRLTNGRSVEVRIVGDVADGCLVYLHGTPSAAVPFTLLEEAAARHGLGVLSCSRPGYGTSTPDPGRTVASVSPDVTAVLGELGVERFVAVGWSGGGPHALALGNLPDQRQHSLAATPFQLGPRYRILDEPFADGFKDEGNRAAD